MMNNIKQWYDFRVQGQCLKQVFWFINGKKASALHLITGFTIHITSTFIFVTYAMVHLLFIFNLSDEVCKTYFNKS
jgi:hypothetical protein